jgi:hypothetical protein
LLVDEVSIEKNAKGQNLHTLNTLDKISAIRVSGLLIADGARILVTLLRSCESGDSV